MSKHKTKNEWIALFKKYEKGKWDWDHYYKNYVSFSTRPSIAKRKSNRNPERKLKYAKFRFINKYNLWKLLDNTFMEKKIETRGRKKRRSKNEIEEVVNNLTDEELKDIAKRYIEITQEQDKKKESSNFKWPSSRKAYIFNMHRTTFYKNSKTRKYKFDFARDEVTKIFNNSYKRYGSKRLAIELSKKGILINDRTLRHYMIRWGIVCNIRRKKRRSELKNISAKYKDLVNRNYNPKEDNIIATDVSYIPAKVKQNFVYLSVAISHKTKLVESWKLSLNNDIELVKNTLSNIKPRKGLIIHSDHGSQYSSNEILNLHKYKGSQLSMSRIGNSLDNREVEYFFSNIKSECLNDIKTDNMNLEQIISIIDEYIQWYNTKRIQSRLQWKTPTEVSAYAI